MQRQVVTNDAFWTLVITKNNKLDICWLFREPKLKSYKLRNNYVLMMPWLLLGSLKDDQNHDEKASHLELKVVLSNVLYSSPSSANILFPGNILANDIKNGVNVKQESVLSTSAKHS